MRPLRCSASCMQSKMAIELALARYFELRYGLQRKGKNRFVPPAVVDVSEAEDVMSWIMHLNIMLLSITKPEMGRDKSMGCWSSMRQPWRPLGHSSPITSAASATTASAG